MGNNNFQKIKPSYIKNDKLINGFEEITDHYKDIFGDNKIKFFKPSFSKKGEICLYEKGGSFGEIGSSTIITGVNFERLHPVYVIPRSKVKPCGVHAVIPIRYDYHIIESVQHGIDFITFVYEIIDISEIDVIGKLISNFSTVTLIDSGSEKKLSKKYKQYASACDIAMDKAEHLHCKKAYYIKK